MRGKVEMVDGEIHLTSPDENCFLQQNVYSKMFGYMAFDGKSKESCL